VADSGGPPAHGRWTGGSPFTPIIQVLYMSVSSLDNFPGVRHDAHIWSHRTYAAGWLGSVEKPAEIYELLPILDVC